MRFGIGQPVTRKEDARFLTGRGRYVADIDFVRQAHAVLVFSPHSSLRVTGCPTPNRMTAPLSSR